MLRYSGLVSPAVLVLGLALLGLAGCARPASRPAPPYPPSPVIAGITWEFAGLVRLAPGSDLWPMTWAADDNLYTAWGDGGGFGGTNREGRVSLGFARIIGSPPHLTAVNVWGGKAAENPATFGGKVGDLLAVDGVLYALGGVWPGPAGVSKSESPHECRLLWSHDLGKSWHYASWTFADVTTTTFAPSSFLHFGKDYAGARDRFVYLYGGKPWWAGTGHDIYLVRVPREQIKRREAYEFFAGLDAAASPTWTTDEAQRKPVFTDPNSVSSWRVVYHPGLRRYLMAVSHGGVGQLGIFDAPEPWGPWTTVAYDEDWGRFGRGEALNYVFPTKWMSADGTTLWMVFSSVGELDAFHLLKATLTLRAASPNSLPLDGRG